MPTGKCVPRTVRTGNKLSGLWLVVGVCVISAGLTFLLRYGEIGKRLPIPVQRPAPDRTD